MIYESIRNVAEYLAFFFYQESSIRRDLVDSFVEILANSLVHVVHSDKRFAEFLNCGVKLHRDCACKRVPEIRLEINTMNSETRLAAIIDDAASVMQLTTFEVASFLPLSTNIYFSSKYAFYVTGKNAPIFIYMSPDCPLRGEVHPLKMRRLLRLDFDGITPLFKFFHFDEIHKKKNKKKKKPQSISPVPSTSSMSTFIRPTTTRVSSAISYAAMSRRSPQSSSSSSIREPTSPAATIAPKHAKPRPPPLIIAKAEDSPPLPQLTSRLLSYHQYAASHSQRLMYSRAYSGANHRHTPRSAPPTTLPSTPDAVTNNMGKVEFGQLFRQMVQARIA